MLPALTTNLRISSSGNRHNYTWDGQTLVRDYYGNTILDFSYDANGQPYAMHYNSTPYFYILNLQGDVIRMVDGNGNTVASYEYDPYGRVVSATGSMADINPLRYRGYYYDSETKLYHLWSRYYDPQTGRFINADDVSVIEGDGANAIVYNLFAYCMNNPVNMTDSIGYWPSWATKVLIGTAVIAAAAILTVATAGTGTALACFAVGALKGAAVGAAVGAATGAAGGAVSHRITTGSWDGAGQAALEGAADGYMSGAITGFISGGLTSNVCFAAGTSVLTAAGHVAIETINAGDYVFATDPETDTTSLKRVVQTFVNETTEIVHVTINGEDILCTSEHPFYSPVKGWTEACRLRAGDILVTVNGVYVVVEKIQHEFLEQPIKVYNFEVEGFHTYHVGNTGVLVHNTCHGNSLNTSKKTDLYVLRDNSTNIVKKIGETTRGVSRYSKKFYVDNNVYMQIIDSGSKKAMHFQQHRLLTNYYSHVGKLPGFNKSFW